MAEKVSLASQSWVSSRKSFFFDPHISPEIWRAEVTGDFLASRLAAKAAACAALHWGRASTEGLFFWTQTLGKNLEFSVQQHQKNLLIFFCSESGIVRISPQTNAKIPTNFPLFFHFNCWTFRKTWHPFFLLSFSISVPRSTYMFPICICCFFYFTLIYPRPDRDLRTHAARITVRNTQGGHRPPALFPPRITNSRRRQTRYQN